MNDRNFPGRFKSIVARGGIIVFFIMAFEVMIMISPFAFFFYSVFNPILHWLQDYSATRWLTSFFLPHMILPPTTFLRAVRILGSVLFVIGCLTFLVCAFQVYFGKIFKWGVASKGLYGLIRHPQYLALGLWGTGMSILWPRFLVLVSLSLMFILYYFLAKDEERRMLGQFGESYSEYMNRTGMFLPGRVENFLLIPFKIVAAKRPAICLHMFFHNRYSHRVRLSPPIHHAPLHWIEHSGKHHYFAYSSGRHRHWQAGAWKDYRRKRRKTVGVHRLSKGLPRLSDARRLRHAGNDSRYRWRVPFAQGT